MNEWVGYDVQDPNPFVERQQFLVKDLNVIKVRDGMSLMGDCNKVYGPITQILQICGIFSSQMGSVCLYEFIATSPRLRGRERVEALDLCGIEFSAHQRVAILMEDYSPIDAAR